jgi:Zn-dependent protease
MGSNWWVAETWQQNPAMFVSWVFWVIGSIVLHELSHGWAAIRCGDRTPIEAGHMTWNPLVHMGGMSLLMFAIVGIAWGQMPVSPNRFRGRYDDARVAAAGPAMNFALAVVAAVLGGVWVVFAGNGNVGQPLYGNTLTFFLVGVSLNIALMLFNLIPVPPLDGSRITANFVPEYQRVINTEKGAIASLIAFVLLFFFFGNVLFDFAFEIGGKSIGAVATGLRQVF